MKKLSLICCGMLMSAGLVLGQSQPTESAPTLGAMHSKMKVPAPTEKAELKAQDKGGVAGGVKSKGKAKQTVEKARLESVARKQNTPAPKEE